MRVEDSPALRGDIGTRAGEPEGFHTAMVHLYRGEMQRMTVWRSRLDTTSNWAILLTTGMTTFAFGSPNIPHYILLLGLALIGICMLIEARRYRHMLHSKWRIELMEAHYFERLLRPLADPPEAEWKRQLADDLARPRVKTTFLMAFRLRLRRNYLLLVYFISAVWLTKVFLHPRDARTLSEFYDRLVVGELMSSWFVAGTFVAFVLASTVLAAVSPSEESLDLHSR